MEPPASVVLLTRSSRLQNDWRLRISKYINKLACIADLYRRLPTTALSTSAGFMGFGPVLVFFSAHMVHVVVGDRHVLPWKLSKISRPSRQAFHSHCGRAKGASASVREYRPVLRLLGCANSCWGQRPRKRRGSGLAWFRS